MGATPPETRPLRSESERAQAPWGGGAELSQTVEAVVARVSPSVVHLSGSMPERSSNGPLESLHGTSVRMLRAGPLGSGVLVEGGLVVTNAHVIEHAERLEAELSDGRVVDAAVVTADPDKDLAVLRLEGDLSELEPIRMSPPGLVRRGEVVLAIGNPFGLGCSVAMGVASTTGTLGAEGEEYLQTDAAIQYQNSGGPVVNLRGEMIGLANARVTGMRGLRGMAYVTPVHVVQSALAPHGDDPQLHEPATPATERGALRGVSVSDVDESTRARYGLGDHVQYGAVVTAVDDDSPAAEVGIQPGDTIVELDLTAVVGADALQAAKMLGGPLLVLVLRGDAAIYLVLHP